MTPSALVTFRAAGLRYGLDVACVVEVRERGAIRPLPAPLPGVLGVLDEPDGPGLAVLAPFGEAGAHLVVVAAGGHVEATFTLLVDEVERVVPVPEGALAPAPAGQAAPIVTGALGDILVVDPERLGAHLRAPGPTAVPERGS